jgi:hypothetical protein
MPSPPARETPASSTRTPQEFRQVHLVNWALAAGQRGILLRIVLDQDDIVAEFSETRTSYQTDVAGTDHSKMHSSSTILSIMCVAAIEFDVQLTIGTIVVHFMNTPSLFFVASDEGGSTGREIKRVAARP